MLKQIRNDIQFINCLYFVFNTLRIGVYTKRKHEGESSMIIELKHISKSYIIDKKTVYPVIKNLNLEFSIGEFVAITGPSGCGKSTLLNMIAGFDKPTKGDLIIEKRSTKEYKEKDWDIYRRDSIGFVFQQFNLIEHLSAIENIEFVMNLVGLSKKEQRVRAMELLAEVGLSGHENYLPSELSGGQKQRIAIARALANNPDIILADEPTGALDSENGQVIMELLTKIAKNKLVLMVTHNRVLAKEYATRIISMKDGVVIADERKIVAENKRSKHQELKKRTFTLPFRETFKLALHNMKKKRSRTMVTIVAGAIGILGIALVLGLGNGVDLYVNQKLNNFVTADILHVQKGVDSGGTTSFATDMEDFKSIRDNVSVLEVRPELPTTMMTLSHNDEKITSTFYAISGEGTLNHIQNNYLGEIPKKGKQELLVNNATAVALLQQMNLPETDLQAVIGIEVEVGLGTAFQKIFTITGVNDESFAAAMSYYQYDTMKTLLEEANVNLETTLYEVIVENVNDNTEVYNWVASTENGGAGALFSGTIYTDPRAAGFTVMSIPVRFQTMFNQLLLIAQIVLLSFMVIALIVSAIMTAIVLYAGVLERKVEIGILRALGSRKKDITRMFKSEAILIGLFSASSGLGLAFLLQPILNYTINQMLSLGADIIQIPLLIVPFTDIVFPLASIISLVGISVLVAYIAGLLPARRAAALPVVDALREE